MKQFWMKAALGLALLHPLWGVAQAPTPQVNPPAPAAQNPPQAATTAAPEEEEGRFGRRRGRASVTIEMSEQDAERLREAIQDPELKKKIEEHIDRIGGQINPREWRGAAFMALMIPILGIGLGALTIWLLFRGFQARTRARMELHTALLAKFSTGAEFTEFISSPGGKEYLERLTAGSHQHGAGHWGRSAWIGYVFTLMGGGMLAVRLVQGGSLIGGVVMLAIGVGHLLAMRATKQQEERLDPPSGLGGPSA
jgi:hypothetical protein